MIDGKNLLSRAEIFRIEVFALPLFSMIGKEEMIEKGIEAIF